MVNDSGVSRVSIHLTQFGYNNPVNSICVAIQYTRTPWMPLIRFDSLLYNRTPPLFVRTSQIGSGIVRLFARSR